MDDFEQAESGKTISRRGVLKILSGLAAGGVASSINRRTGNVLASEEIEKLPSESWGKLANSELPNDITRSAFFFAGPKNPDSTIQNLNPITEWDDNTVGKIFDDLKSSGVNSVDLSWWGHNDEYKKYSPTLCTNEVIKQVFDECSNRKMLVSPVLEVSPDFEFWKDYPDDTTKLEDRIEYFVTNYGDRENWQKMYGKDGEARLVVKLIETIHGEKIDPAVFAAGFDRVASKIHEKTGKKIGFVIDPTPLPAGGSHEGPDPEALKSTESLLAINPYNLYSEGNNEDERLDYAQSVLAKWHGSGIPVIASVVAGFDDTHFRSPGQKYGYNENWYTRQKEIVREYQTVGIRIDNWNAVTEGSAAIETVEKGKSSYEFVNSVLRDRAFNPVAPRHMLYLGGIAKN